MTERDKDVLVILAVLGIVFLMAFLMLRAADKQAVSDQTINIDEPEFHQTSAIVCNRAIPPQVRPERKVTFA